MTERTANEIWAGASLSPASLSRSLFRVLETLATWQQRARERAQLASMDERSLSDMGINRADVWRECRKPFWQE